jgi:DNA-directed RNA polymerase
MGEILRRQFVSLHSQPLLEDLLKFYRHTFPNIPFNQIPQRGDFQMSRVLDSTYFFA